jgi:hypothetical protein
MNRLLSVEQCILSTIVLCFVGGPRIVIFRDAPGSLSMDELEELGNQMKGWMSGGLDLDEMCAQMEVCGVEEEGEHGYHQTEMLQAAMNGDVEEVRRLHEIGVSLTSMTMALAAEQGRWDVLHFLEQTRCPYDEIACASAAFGGQLQVLQWLRESCNCPWDSQTILNAVIGEQEKVLEWALEHGCPCDASVMEDVVRTGHLGQVKACLLHYKLPCIPEKCIDVAKECQKFEMVSLFENQE